LNLTATEYFKRTKYFTYLNIDVYSKSDEDIKKHFRISNRFISECLAKKGKILIHDFEGKLSPCFAIAYMINNEKIPLKECIDIISTKREQKLDLNANFLK
jgi:hypothetical protein